MFFRFLIVFIFPLYCNSYRNENDIFHISIPKEQQQEQLQQQQQQEEQQGTPKPVLTYNSRKYLRRHGIKHDIEQSGLESAQGSGDLWFQQILDHFHPTEFNRTWKQRYFVNEKFYKKGGPIFLMIGGEGKANPIWMNEGTWIEYAKEMGALCFQLEHRFYGDSHPTEDMSVKNLVYLSSEQALADLAYFVSEMNVQYNLTDSKWIAFGGSYPGSLAAWLRLKYPHLIHGSVSTSGPLKAKADFFEYLQVVSDAFDQTNKKCKPAIQEGMKKLQLLGLHRVGWKMITKDFKLCTPFEATSSVDVSNFYENIIGNFEDVVQYNKDNREFEGAKYTNITVETLCDIMTKPTNEDDYEFQGQFTDALLQINLELDKTKTNEDLLDLWEKIPGILYQSRNSGKSNYQRLAEVNDLVLKMNGEKCMDYKYESMIKELSNVSWDSSAGVGGRQWQYQTCTEFGWYQSSDQPDHPYTDLFPVQFLEKQCQDIFGPQYNLKLLDKGIKRTNILYGSKNIKVTNVVFVHGTFDPWHALGITESLSESATAILIPGTAHCANMYPSSPNDPPELTKARETVKQSIKKWLL